MEDGCVFATLTTASVAIPLILKFIGLNKRATLELTEGSPLLSNYSCFIQPPPNLQPAIFI